MGYVIEKVTQTVTQEVEEVTGCTCDECKRPLVPVDPDWGWDGSGPSGGLDVTLVGGYGQFFDSRSVHLILCQECARRLMQSFPSFDLAIGQAIARDFGLSVEEMFTET